MNYRDEYRALYVSPYNTLNEVLHVSDDIGGFWSLLWQEAKDDFDDMLQNDSNLAHLSCKMFYM
jgi:hypothetical protein